MKIWESRKKKKKQSQTYNITSKTCKIKNSECFLKSETDPNEILGKKQSKLIVVSEKERKKLIGGLSPNPLTPSTEDEAHRSSSTP